MAALLDHVNGALAEARARNAVGKELGPDGSPQRFGDVLCPTQRCDPATAPKRPATSLQLTCSPEGPDGPDGPNNPSSSARPAPQQRTPTPAADERGPRDLRACSLRACSLQACKPAAYKPATCSLQACNLQACSRLQAPTLAKPASLQPAKPCGAAVPANPAAVGGTMAILAMAYTYYGAIGGTSSSSCRLRWPRRRGMAHAPFWRPTRRRGGATVPQLASFVLCPPGADSPGS